MFAATAARIDADDPLSGLELGEHPEPAVPDGKPRASRGFSEPALRHSATYSDADAFAP